MRAIILFSFLCVLSTLTWAQTPQAQTAQTAQTQPAGGGVTGSVKVGTKAAKGITVGLARDVINRNAGPANSAGAPGLPPPPPPPAPSVRAVTDDRGQFVFSNVAPGDYRVTAIAESYVIADSSVAQFGVPVSVVEGQTATASELVLARGGVITGKVSDPDGRPVIAERINISEMDSAGRVRNVSGGGRGTLETDDRGVYRVYGLTEGRYTLSAGSGDSGFGPIRRAHYARTWHPNVSDQASATVVEVGPGKVVENVDIKLGEPLKTYSVQGRAVDATTGKPVPGVSVMVMRQRPVQRGQPGAMDFFAGGFDGGPAGDQPGMSDEQGVFKIGGLTTGSYSVNTSQGMRGPGQLGSDYYGDPSAFQIGDGDATGVELKLHLGVTITGILKIEGVTDGPTLARLLPQVSINATVRPEQGAPNQGNRSGRFSMGQVSGDGTFRISGLEPGRTTFNLNARGGIRLGLVRVERNGAAAQNELQTTSGEQVLNLVITAREANSGIRGRVVASTGQIGPNYQVRLTARSLDGSTSNGATADATGSFEIDGLMPGSYEVTARATPRFPNQNPGGVPGRGGSAGGVGGGPGGRPGGQGGGQGGARQPVRIPEAKQLVSVTAGNVATVTITIDLSQTQ